MSSMSWEDYNQKQHLSSAITPHNRRQALEILHHDPLYIEPADHNDQDENREAVSLLFHTSNLQYVDVTVGAHQHQWRCGVCGGYCLQYRWKILLFISFFVVLVLAVKTQLDTQYSPHSLQNTLNRHQDQCRYIFNKSIDELLQDVSTYTTPNQWCVVDEADCICGPTLQGSPPTWYSQAQQEFWNQTLHRNVKLASQANAKEEDWDVVLYGDSITEHWLGTELSTRWEQWQGTKRVFQQYFNSSNGASVDGLALGISGDQVRWYWFWDVSVRPMCASCAQHVFIHSVWTVAVQITKW
jgi:hypothetical protein